MVSRRKTVELLGSEDALKALPPRKLTRKRYIEDTSSNAITNSSKRIRKKKTELSQEALLEGLEADLAGLQGNVEDILGRSVNLEEGDETSDEGTGNTSTKSQVSEKDGVKKVSKKQLRKVASEASSKLSHQDNVSVEPTKKISYDSELNMFYRKTPVGKALYATLEMMMEEGLLVDRGDAEILSKFDETARDILVSSNKVLSIPFCSTSGRRQGRARTLRVEGDLVSYNNWRNHWALEAENVVYRFGEDILHAENERGVKIFVKAADSKPSSGLGRKTKT